MCVKKNNTVVDYFVTTTLVDLERKKFNNKFFMLVSFEKSKNPGVSVCVGQC
jgi:hypothetical protein